MIRFDGNYRKTMVIVTTV